MTKPYPYPPGEGRIRWISTNWLEEHLDDKNLMKVDVQPNVHDYILEHIPGAVYFNERLLRVPFKGRPGVYGPEEAIQANFRRIGLVSDQPVVVYTGLGGFQKSGKKPVQLSPSGKVHETSQQNSPFLTMPVALWKFRSFGSGHHSHGLSSAA
ncbi:MAG: rhodanese-like domain-containing protein [Candidatus Methanofastidiosia archaeon]